MTALSTVRNVALGVGAGVAAGGALIAAKALIKDLDQNQQLHSADDQEYGPVRMLAEFGGAMALGIGAVTGVGLLALGHPSDAFKTSVATAAVLSSVVGFTLTSDGFQDSLHPRR